MSTTITITDLPDSLAKRLGNKVSFSAIQWLYWDGMDWCQYDEVLPREGDISAYEKHIDSTTTSHEYVSFQDLTKNLWNTK